MQTDFLLSADAARIVGVTPASIREAALAGRLVVAATTAGGVRLFRSADVEAFRRQRAKTRRNANAADGTEG
jgi:hypothetical protein